MKKGIYLITLLIGLSFGSNQSFRDAQYKYPMVKKAMDYWEVEHRTKLGISKIEKENFEIYIRGFKTEKQLEVWARTKGAAYYKLVGSYNWCSNVGYVGPKRKKGDRQIPEGIYKISQFNPVSSHHLGLKVNYPNASDSVLGEMGNLGGSIFIHGGCHTIGCVPLSNEGIEQLYVWCVMAKQFGQQEIPVHLFPNRMNYGNYRKLIEDQDHKEHHDFWGNLRTAYAFFERFGYLPAVQVNEEGLYLFDDVE